MRFMHLECVGEETLGIEKTRLRWVLCYDYLFISRTQLEYYVSLRSTKENAYYLCTVHEVVTVLYAMRFHGLDAILDRPGTFCLDLMCSVFLTRELVSILWHSFTDETLAIFCSLQDCLKFFWRFFYIGKFPF